MVSRDACWLLFIGLIVPSAVVEADATADSGARLLILPLMGTIPKPLTDAPRILTDVLAFAAVRTGGQTDVEICQPAGSEERTGSPAGLASSIEGEPVLKLLPHDAIASVDEPRMVPAAEAGGFMQDDEMVIGVAEGQEARAYSIWHLDRHEIVNDRLGETPIAATW